MPWTLISDAEKIRALCDKHGRDIVPYMTTQELQVAVLASLIEEVEERLDKALGEGPRVRRDQKPRLPSPRGCAKSTRRPNRPA